MKKKMIVIGGGASGMAAAVVAAHKGKNDVEITILEKNEILGKKLLATGNGRCNFTNIDCVHEDFLSQKKTQDTLFQEKALDLFPAHKTLRFFAGLGVLARVEDEGRTYPYSGQGTAIQEALVRTIDELGIEVQYGSEVIDVKKADQGFDVYLKQGVVHGDFVVMALGGKAGLQFGTTGDGYKLIQRLGHEVVKPIPALVPVSCLGAGLQDLKGVRAKGKVTLYLNEIPLAEEEGEIQFTEDGLSGICVFNISRYIQWENGQLPKGYEIAIDFSPELSQEEVFSLLQGGKEVLEHMSISLFLKGVLHGKLAVAVLDSLHVDKEQRIGEIPDENLWKLAGVLKDWRVTVCGTKSWREAQVTCGGVALKQVDPETMESKLIEGLYITGEMLDIDGRCGGFNLQWAWCTGYIAGRNIASR